MALGSSLSKLSSLPLLTFALAAQTTWTVDSAGGAQFTTVPAAISAASPGDRVLVQGPGPYAAFVVDRGIDVEALAGASCDSIGVVGVPAGQRARIRDFVIVGNNGAVTVSGCAGEVTLLQLDTQGGAVLGSGNPGLRVQGSGNVFCRDCTFRGHPATLGTPGVIVDGATLVMVACRAEGGLAFGGAGVIGWPGVYVTNSGSVVLADSVALGAPAAVGTLFGPNGGDGVQVANGGAYVLGGCDLRGMPGGFGTLLPGAHGHAARGNVRLTVDTLLTGPSSTAVAIPNRPRLACSGTTPIGGTLSVSLQGEPVQPVFLGIDLAHIALPLPAFDGVLSISAYAPLFTVIVLDGSGVATLDVPIPNVPQALHQDLLVQALASVAGAPVLSPPTQSRVQ